jgi:hypothetical protein
MAGSNRMRWGPAHRRLRLWKLQRCRTFNNSEWRLQLRHLDVGRRHSHRFAQPLDIAEVIDAVDPSGDGEHFFHNAHQLGRATARLGHPSDTFGFRC